MKARSPNASIDVERYAEIIAHLRHFPDGKKAEVIARLGVRRPDWDAASARWSKDLDASVDDGSADLMKRYSAALTRARRRLTSLRPTIESLGPLPEPEPAPESPPPPPPEPQVVPEPIPTAERKVELPSFMVQTPLPPPPPSSPYSAPPPSSSYSAPPSSPYSAPPSQPQPAPFVPKLQTMLGDVSPFAKAPLPFHQGSSPEQALENAVAHTKATQPQGPVSSRSSAALGATIAAEPAEAGPSLPFTRPDKVPDYTVTQYASLRVELHEYPDRSAEILARYKLDRETHHALDDYWRARFKADPTLLTSFLDACDRYKQWIKTR